MLKLTYTENGFYLELLAQPLEEWVTARVILALRSGTSLCVEPSNASFLLPADLPHLNTLERQGQTEDAIALCLCDADYVEVSLQGTWLSSDPNGEEGIFVTVMSYAVEFFLFKLWQEAQTMTSVISE
ncbi:MAG: hypothetical protein F6J92_02540 [Symploca sp. SIO1A3]|nr:hypothetical protein [Symploca sp. SIO2C1]NER45574.1 hypothetical protein [Symploca sp. SIO1A3]